MVLANASAVLIETLWNVKVHLHKPGCHHHQVLIETLWNVKLFKREISERIASY